MFNKFCLATFLFLAIYDSVNCAMKKSWKSAANFDTEVPKFTPFTQNNDLLTVEQTNLDEIVIKTTETPTSPSPSAETLVNKISSKIKGQSNELADIYDQFYQEMHKKPSEDFGTIGDTEENHESPDTLEDIVEPIQPNPVHEEFNIQQILNKLSAEADRESNTNSDSLNNDESIDEFEISSIPNESTNKTQFKVGPLMNVTVDSSESSVNVNLDQNTLKEIFTGSSS